MRTLPLVFLIGAAGISIVLAGLAVEWKTQKLSEQGQIKFEVASESSKVAEENKHVEESKITEENKRAEENKRSAKPKPQETHVESSSIAQNTTSSAGSPTPAPLPSLTPAPASTAEEKAAPEPSWASVTTAIWPASLLLTMLIGILFGSCYAMLVDVSTTIQITHVLREVTRKPQFWRAVLAAPIVFAGVYVFAVDSIGNTIISLIFAFQNGFFCEAILREKSSAPGVPPTLPLAKMTGA
jgi:hypothetical protein